MSTKQIHVCPDCQSPYLETTVLATAKVNSNFDWELNYQFPDDLNPIVTDPGTEIMCTNCDWIGTYAETTIVTDTALDGLQYDNGSTSPSPLPIVKAASVLTPHNKQMPSIKQGTTLLIDDPSIKYINYELTVIGVNTTACRYVTIVNDQPVFQVGQVSMFLLTPTETDMWQNAFLILSGPELQDMYSLGKMTIVNPEVKTLPDLPDDSTNDGDIEEPRVQFLPE